MPSTTPYTAKRHMGKMKFDAIDKVSSQGIRRMANRGGTKRMSSLVYARVRTTMYTYLKNIVRSSMLMTRNSRRKTVSLDDVKRALKGHGRILYYTETTPKKTPKKKVSDPTEY